MKKQFIKFCLTSILSLSLNTDLQAQEFKQTIQTPQEITIENDVAKQVDSFIRHSLITHPTLNIRYNRENIEITILQNFVESGEAIDKFLESLANQSWLGSLKKFEINDLPHTPDPLSEVLSKASRLESLSFKHLSLNQKEHLNVVVSALTKTPDLQTLDLSNTYLGTGLVDLVPIIAKMTKLQTLILASNKLTDSTILKVVDRIKKSQESSQKSTTSFDLHVLDLSYNNLTAIPTLVPDKREALVELLSYMPNLRQLNLQGNQLGKGRGALSLGPVLEKMSHLDTLNLGKNDLKQRVSAFKKLYNLKNLDLSYNNLKGKDLSDVLLGTSKLQTLILEYNNLNKEDLEILTPAFSNMGNLQVLNLRHNCLEELQFLIPSFSNMPELRVLNLNSNYLGEDLSLLAPTFANMHNLKELYLYDNEINDSTLINFLSILAEKGGFRRMSNLEVLNLSFENTKATSPIVENDLAIFLYYTTNLHELNLSGCNLGEDVDILIPAIENMINLEKLDLSQNKITGEKLAIILSNTPNLRELNLSGNDLAQGVVALGSALGGLSYLQNLNLSCGHIGSGLIALAPAFANMINLQELRLDFNDLNKVNPDTWHVVMAALSLTTNLQELNLDKNGITGYYLNAFVDAILQTESIAGIPNLLCYSNFKVPQNHPLYITLALNERAGIHTLELQTVLNAYNPAIKVLF